MRKDRKFIQITHVMLGGLLVFHRRYSILNDVLFYSNVLPPEYHLLPNSLVEISERLNDLDEVGRNFMLLESSFAFANLNHGVQNDSAISYEAIRFLGLCVIRLWSVHPTMFTDQPLAKPDVPNDLGEIKTMIQHVSQLKRCVDEWYNKEVFQKVEKMEVVSQENVNNLLNEWQTRLIEARDYREEHPQAGDEQVKTFKEELIAASQQSWRVMPTKEDSDIALDAEVNTLSTIEVVNDNIEVKLFDPSFNICYTNLPDAFIRFMSLPTIHEYLSRINGDGVISYKIQYKDIFRALDKLAISETHYLLSAGVYLGQYTAMYGDVEGFDNIANTYRGVKVHSIDSQMMSLFVIPKSCLPFVEYTGISPTPNLQPLDDSNTLFSNLHEMLAPGFDQSTFFMTLARGVKITSLKDGYRCIRLDVTHNSSEGALDIENVKW